jgi:hypothetical protein
MFDRKFRLAISLAVFLAGAAAGQRANAEQSPRQAMIEMLSGGEAAFKKHLTVEMQGRLQNLMKGSYDNAPGSNKFQAFDLGPILFSFNNPQEHERYEVQIDREEPRGEEDIMALSVHLVRGGLEQPTPASLNFALYLKRQEGIWRLNAVTVSAMLAVGDPRILDKSWVSPVLAAVTGGNIDATPTTSVVVDERPKLSPLRAVRMIGMAETIYAQKHPGLGYTCALADLVNIGRGMDVSRYR